MSAHSCAPSFDICGAAMAAFDDYGNEVFPVCINTICPVEHANEARQIAFRHMTKVEDATNDQLSQMLNVNLGPIGQNQITHVFCSRNGYTHQYWMEIRTLASQNLSWCGVKEYTEKDSPEEIKSLFCCVLGERDEVLRFLGLEKK